MGFESICRQILKQLNERTIMLPNDPKLVVRVCFGAFWVCNKMLSYGRLTINFSIVVVAQARWLLSYGNAFLPDALGNMLLYCLLASG